MQKILHYLKSLDTFLEDGIRLNIKGFDSGNTLCFALCKDSDWMIFFVPVGHEVYETEFCNLKPFHKASSSF